MNEMVGLSSSICVQKNCRTAFHVLRHCSFIGPRGQPIPRCSALAAPPYTYKAFISYSHTADSQLAPSLQLALERFAKPWYRMRNFHIFRDTTNLAITPKLWPEIERALGQSAHLLLMASEEAAGSKWVKKELTYWLEHKGPDQLFLILTSGRIVWDDKAGDFEWGQTTVLPDVLKGTFASEPLYLDFSGFRAGHLSLDDEGFLDRVATLAAALHGRSKDEIFGEHIRQHRRTLRLAWSAALVLVMLLVGVTIAGLAAYNEYSIAEKRRQEALSRQLAAQAEMIRTQQPRQLEAQHAAGPGIDAACPIGGSRTDSAVGDGSVTAACFAGEA